MKKSEILKLLKSEGWTKADALRAIASIDFSTDPDELSIRRAISNQFIGSELSQRQHLQSSQTRLVTIKNGQIKLLQQQLSQQAKGADDNKQAEKITELQQQVQQHRDRADGLAKQVEELNTNNQLFVKADRIGNKYQSPAEIMEFEQNFTAISQEIEIEIDRSFPDTVVEIIDFSKR